MGGEVEEDEMGSRRTGTAKISFLLLLVALIYAYTLQEFGYCIYTPILSQEQMIDLISHGRSSLDPGLPAATFLPPTPSIYLLNRSNHYMHLDRPTLDRTAQTQAGQQILPHQRLSRTHIAYKQCQNYDFFLLLHPFQRAQVHHVDTR